MAIQIQGIEAKLIENVIGINSYKEILDNISDGVYCVDTTRRILYWNHGAERITGFRSEEVVGSYCYNNLLNHVDEVGTQLCHGKCPLVTCIEDGQAHESDIFLRHKDGHRVPVSVRTSPLCDENGQVIGAVEIFSDNSKQVEIVRNLGRFQREAFIDPLTGLGNRRFAEQTLKSRFEEWKRYEWPFGLLFLDIDNFKRINDTYGHAIGDAVLKMVSKTLTRASRPFDFISRWGGEEFIAVIVNPATDQLLQIGQRFCHLTHNSRLLLDDQCITVTVSIGATMIRKADTIQSLIKRADQLLYWSKLNGRNCVTQDSSDAESDGRLEE